MTEAQQAGQEEHDKADRAMARVFKRLVRCQKAGGVPGGGVCGKCLLEATMDWRRYTAAPRFRKIGK
jgi:hypothetical protein